MRPLLPSIARLAEDLRVVGTASSLLRGIDLPVGDVDIAGRHRDVVDALAGEAVRAKGACLSAPAWHADWNQYFAEYVVAGVRVGFSTVETPVTEETPVHECVGAGPWEHYDVVVVEGHRVPVVASELRLVSEVIRDRPDRWRPLGMCLADNGYDAELLERALRGRPDEVASVVREALGTGPAIGGNA
jgi:hypothetical protein